ncbi:MAG: hypothetical protein ILP11_02580 [Alphaproteobacteria bacterium]|nr:hypothetical protein [Alphaproteobacteria bacterium]
MQSNTKFCLLGAVLVALAGCIPVQHVDETAEYVETVYGDVSELVEVAKIPDRAEPVDTVVTKEDIWLGQDSFKIVGGEKLPAELDSQDSITIAINDPVDLVTLVDELRNVTGLRYSIEELRAADKLPTETITVNYEGTLSGLLDYISNKYSIWWRYRKGEVSFYDQETRVFTVYALPVSDTSLSASLSGTPNSSEGSASTLSMSTSVALSVWEQIEEGLTLVMGSFSDQKSINKTSGTITVTAPPFVIQKVARYIQDLNEKMSRQVAISVKVLSVSLSSDDKYGLDLTAAFKNHKLGANFSSSFVAGANLPGSLSMQLIDPKSKWYGTEGIIEAISTQGKTALLTSTSVTTLNNKVAPVQVTTQKSYVASTEIQKDSNGDGGYDVTVQLTPEVLNYGFTMELLPRILDNGRLILLFTMTLTDLVSLENFSSDGSSVDPDVPNSDSSSGSDSSEEGETTAETDSSVTTVQLPTLQTRGFVQEIAMRSGSTLVLTGFETIQARTTTSGIGQPKLSILGGQAYAQEDRNVLVILLTPEILVSPLAPESRMEHF